MGANFPFSLFHFISFLWNWSLMFVSDILQKCVSVCMCLFYVACFPFSMMFQSSVVWHAFPNECVAFHHLTLLFNKYLSGIVDLWKFIVRLVQVLLFQFFDRTLLTICRSEDPKRRGNRILDPHHRYLIIFIHVISHIICALFSN